MPSTCTVQAPHRPCPQPNLVPVKPSSSRITQSSGVPGSAWALTALPFKLKGTLIPVSLMLTLSLQRRSSEKKVQRDNPRRHLDRTCLDTAVTSLPRCAGQWENRRMSTTSSRLADLRKSYERAELSEDASHADPLKQFDQWLTEAISAEIPEPNAMTLATVASDLRPSTRVVLVKGYDERGIVWYTNYESRKGQEMAGNPYAALQFHWVELERVVRIEGRVEKTSAGESDAYYATRPLDSRIGAWASP